jgi:hypothetical protein
LKRREGTVASLPNVVFHLGLTGLKNCQGVVCCLKSASFGQEDCAFCDKRLRKRSGKRVKSQVKMVEVKRRWSRYEFWDDLTTKNEVYPEITEILSFFWGGGGGGGFGMGFGGFRFLTQMQ